MSENDSMIENNTSKLWRGHETLLMGLLLVVVAALAWLGVVRQAAEMQDMSSDTVSSIEMNMGGTGMEGEPASASNPASLTDAVTYLIAWGVMMTAMMLPSAIPMIALYGALSRNFSQTGQKGLPAALFTLVYLALWLLFGVPIYAANVVVDRAIHSSSTVASLAPYGVALVLLAAGVYQLTPLKRACLRMCQSPLGFLMGHWRSGYRGTFKMALTHAVYCIGCCWGLMVVLVVAGAMALQWVLLIAVAVFVEKVVPRGEWTARFVGGALIVLGLLVSIQPTLVNAL
jgi:predicted metal-binding membrane protein